MERINNVDCSTLCVLAPDPGAFVDHKGCALWCFLGGHRAIAKEEDLDRTPESESYRRRASTRMHVGGSGVSGMGCCCLQLAQAVAFSFDFVFFKRRENICCAWYCTNSNRSTNIGGLLK